MFSGDNTVLKGEKGPFYQTLEGLRHHWDEIVVLCPYTNKSNSFKQLFPNVSVYSLPPFKILHPLSLLLRFYQLKRSHNFDLIVSHDYGLMFNGIGALIIKALFQVPYISEIHHIEGVPYPSGPKDYIYSLWAKVYLNAIAKKVLAIRVVNNNEVLKYIRKTRVDASKVHNIPSLYIDTSIFSPLESSDKIYDFIFCGRLSPNKGIFEILNATKDLIKSYQNLKILIKGRGPLKDQIHEFIRLHRLEKNIDHIEWVKTPEDIANLYRNSKFLICASKSEGGPRVTIEAMACGTPVITTPVGLMPSVIRHGENGFIYNWGKEDLMTLMENGMEVFHQEKYDKISRQAALTAQNFEKNKTLNFYANRYIEILNQTL